MNWIFFFNNHQLELNSLLSDASMITIRSKKNYDICKDYRWGSIVMAFYMKIMLSSVYIFEVQSQFSENILTFQLHFRFTYWPFEAGFARPNEYSATRVRWRRVELLNKENKTMINFFSMFCNTYSAS